MWATVDYSSLRRQCLRRYVMSKTNRRRNISQTCPQPSTQPVCPRFCLAPQQYRNHRVSRFCSLLSIRAVAAGSNDWQDSSSMPSLAPPRPHYALRHLQVLFRLQIPSRKLQDPLRFPTSKRVEDPEALHALGLALLPIPLVQGDQNHTQRPSWAQLLRVLLYEEATLGLVLGLFG